MQLFSDLSLCLQKSCALPRSWQQHGQVDALWQCLRHVRQHSPMGGLWENVLGLLRHRDGERSPLEVIRKDLKDTKYDSTFIIMNLASFHGVTRERRDA